MIEALRDDRLGVQGVVGHVFPIRNFAHAFAVGADTERPGKVLLDFA